jgi:hypothetical protein
MQTQRNRNNKMAYLLLAIMLILPLLVSLFVAAQLYSTIMRFS